MCNRSSGNIFLTGFMGAGKTTIGRLLARRCGRRFIDLDEMIAAAAGMSIREIFAEQGEAGFRDLETRILEEQAGLRDTVFSTGGGIVIRDQNRAVMHRSGTVIYLCASWETLQGRLRGSRNRPLADAEQGWEPVRQLWESRQHWYAEADYTIHTDGRTVEQVVAEARSIALGK